MNIAMTNAVISIVAGIVILIKPKLLNYIVALYLIIVGVVGLLPHIHACFLARLQGLRGVEEEVQEELLQRSWFAVHENGFRREPELLKLRSTRIEDGLGRTKRCLQRLAQIQPDR